MNDKLFRNLKIAVHCIIALTLAFYFLKWVDPKLIDFKQQPVFLFDSHFLHDYLVVPGGFAGYLSLFFSQFFLYPFAGTCIIIVFIYLIVYSTGRLLRSFFPTDYAFILQFIPLLLLAYLHSRYDYSLKPDIIIIMALYPALLYRSLISKPYFFKIPLYIITAVLLAFFIGGNSLILYTFTAVFLEINNKGSKYRALVLLFIIISVLLPFIIGRYTPYMNTQKVFFDIFVHERHYTPIIILYPLFLFYPVFLLFSVIFYSKTEKISAVNSAGWITGITGKTVLLVLPLIIVFITVKFSFSKTEKYLVEINYFAAEKDWSSVINTGNTLPHENRIVIFQINRALYHTGNLANNLFNFRQYWGEEGLLLTKHYNRKLLMPISDIYYELGFIKESLHWAYEAQTEFEFMPAILKRIALNNLILGEYRIAEKYLKILTKSVIHKKWANYYLRYLNNHDLMDSDQEIREKRAFMPKKDFFANNKNPIIDLQNLVEENPFNKMAFEYLIIGSLLKHDLGRVIKYLKYMPDLKYDKIPRHIEEAIVVFIVRQNKTNINLYGYTISNETVKKFNQYSNLLFNKYNNNKAAARGDLYNYFGNTFWYYLHYVSPITTKREFKERVAK